MIRISSSTSQRSDVRIIHRCWYREEKYLLKILVDINLKDCETWATCQCGLIDVRRRHVSFLSHMSHVRFSRFANNIRFFCIDGSSLERLWSTSINSWQVRRQSHDRRYFEHNRIYQRIKNQHLHDIQYTSKEKEHIEIFFRKVHCHSHRVENQFSDLNVSYSQYQRINAPSSHYKNNNFLQVCIPQDDLEYVMCQRCASSFSTSCKCPSLSKTHEDSFSSPHPKVICKKKSENHFISNWNRLCFEPNSTVLKPRLYHATVFVCL